MKRTTLICLFPLFLFNGTEINPQSLKVKNSNEEKMNENLSKSNDDEFRKLLDSLNKENESLVKDVNKYTDIINKNKGYIKNNEKKIEKKVTYTILAKKKKPLNKSYQDSIFSLPESTIVYIPIESCSERRTLIGRFLNDQDCKIWSVTDSIRVEIQNY